MVRLPIDVEKMQNLLSQQAHSEQEWLQLASGNQ